MSLRVGETNFTCEGQLSPLIDDCSNSDLILAAGV